MIVSAIICIQCIDESGCTLKMCCQKCHEEDCQERHCLLHNPPEFNDVEKELEGI